MGRGGGELVPFITKLTTINGYLLKFLLQQLLLPLFRSVDASVNFFDEVMTELIAHEQGIISAQYNSSVKRHISLFACSLFIVHTDVRRFIPNRDE